MLNLSVVIITKNEEQNIERCLKPLLGLAKEILVLDTGSSDATITLAKAMGVRVESSHWKGYAATKNFANQLAHYDWILSLDADEEITTALRKEIEVLFSRSLSKDDAFAIQRKMVYCGKVLRHGISKNEYRTRLFNRQCASWNDSIVHESLLFSHSIVEKKLNNFLWHHSYASELEHRDRLLNYAKLSAVEMHHKGKRSTWIKHYLSPVFHFLKNFILKAGFLDGEAGYRYAKNEMWYVYTKYEQLKRIH